MFDLLELERLTTPASQNAYYSTVCSPPEFEEIGPRIQDIVICAECADGPASFRYTFIGQKAYRQKWIDFSASILGDTAPAADGVASSPYSTRTDLAFPRIQIVCKYRNVTDATAVTAPVSAKAYVRLWT